MVLKGKVISHLSAEVPLHQAPRVLVEGGDSCGGHEAVHEALRQAAGRLLQVPLHLPHLLRLVESAVGGQLGVVEVALRPDGPLGVAPPLPLHEMEYPRIIST